MMKKVLLILILTICFVYQHTTFTIHHYNNTLHWEADIFILHVKAGKHFNWRFKNELLNDISRFITM